MSNLRLAIAITALSISMSAFAQGHYVSLTSTYGHFLQAHKDNGETHASNDSRGDEETWVLIKLDDGMYALRNTSNNKYLAVEESNCIRANRATIDEWTKFHLEEADDHQFKFRSARTDYTGYL